MPFLAKMSSHFRGYSSRDPQSKSIYTHEVDHYPSKREDRLYRDKLVDYDENEYNDDNEEADDYLRRKSSSNEHPDQRNDSDVDYLYRRSREKFASWDIKDLDERRGATKARKGSPREREIADAEVEEIFVNGESSPARRIPRNGTSSREEDRRSSSMTRRPAESQNGKSRARRISEPWSEEEKDYEDQSDQRIKKNGNNRDDMLREIESFGSLKKKNEKNAGLNLGFRAIVDKFRRNSDDREKKDPGLTRSRKQEYVDDDWRYDNGRSNGYKDRRSPSKSPEKFEVYPKDSKTEKNHRIRDHEYEHESRSRRKSPEVEEDYRHHRSRNSDDDRSKRRSYAFEASPEEFDVRIQKYERARRDDTDLHRRNSFHDRGARDSDRHSSKDRNGGEVSRKISLRGKDKENHHEQPKQRESPKGRPPKARVSERHSRPLTPPRNQQVEILTSREDTFKDPSKKSFSMKEWYESNRQFATKYLKEHSKVKELSTSDVSAKDEFIFGSPSESRARFEIENYDRREIRRESVEDDGVDGYRGFSSIGRNEAPATSVVKIRTNAEEESIGKRKTSDGRRRIEENGRRRGHRRESLENEEEEDEPEDNEDEKMARRSARESYGRSFVMPARKIWNYRDGV